MNRRSLLQASLALAGAALVSGHSTSRPWSALQVKHWLIVAARDDAEASRLAGAAATLLAARLPESQALAVQAENDREVVQLLRTHQLGLAVLYQKFGHLSGEVAWGDSVYIDIVFGKLPGENFC